MRLLVVEDDHLLNNTLCHNLSAAGYSVDAATTKAGRGGSSNAFTGKKKYTTLRELASAVLGVLFSVVVVNGISSGIWFFSYRFVMWPMLVIYPFLILLTVAIPAHLSRFSLPMFFLRKV